ncbi:hypothetical protein FB480_103454 [Agrobacterium vitis]|nr:hypothetical protein FB480_103454 [Agrobacterium vitis]
MTPKFLKLAVPGQQFPMPGAAGQFFPAEGMTVNADDPLWANLLADGSLIEASPPASIATTTNSEVTS